MTASLAEALTRVLRTGPPLRLALWFGSGARGALRPDSDLDIAIAPCEALSLADELALQRDLEAATGRDVDLVRLDRADMLLRHRIARDGQVLLEQPGELTRFRAHAWTEWWDFAPTYEHAARCFRRRLVRIAKERM
jgi:predicted nucleotidyltransferase